MPGSVLDPVVGDPLAVASAARTMSAIADEVSRQASRLRALATSASTWTGEAAVGARARSATLPPKLAKVTASYGAAGQALSGYASMLGDAQQRSRTAISAAERAEADLQSATAAQAAAERADATAAAAAATGAPVPSPTAPRYQGAIDDAAARVKQATTGNEAAYEAQREGAATALEAASHQGIRNQSWWHHVTHAVTHWAATMWRAALSQLTAVAGEISLLASIAVVVLAIGGLFFPPLEAAAALAETISLTRYRT
ncbi:MAG: putative T7SS-secreted protein [Acidothermaceae bacterium]